MYAARAILPCTLAVAAPVFAQIGAGWTQYTCERKVHVASGGLQTFDWTPERTLPGVSYKYDEATGIESFNILDDRSNRSEIRLLNDYTSGSRQIEGEVRVTAPIDGQSVMQVFGGSQSATAFQMRAFNNGTLRRYDAELLASNVFGVWQRINVIHDADAGRVTVFINGERKGQFPDRGNNTHYFKYGCYGSLRTATAQTQWRNVRIFRDGKAEGGSSVLLPKPAPRKALGTGWFDVLGKKAAPNLPVLILYAR